MVYLVLRSITYAQRGRDWLKRRGISCHISRLPLTLGENGCGYALRIEEDDLAEAIPWLRLGGISPLRAYRTVGDGYEEVTIE